MENATNFHQVEGQVDPINTSTITTSEDIQTDDHGGLMTSKDNPVQMKPRVTPKTGQKQEKKLSKNEIEINFLKKKQEQIIEYLIQLEKQLTQSKVRETACLLEILDTVYKDCPKVREDSVAKEDAKNYISVLGLYHKEVTKNEMIKIVPLEEGWKMVKITPNDPEKPTEFTADYEFTGVLINADYPISWTVTGQDPYSFTMKLREYLMSLKEEKKIIL